MADQLIEDNRQSWNAAVLAHESHRRDQAIFLNNGGSTLFPEERDLLGDIAGQRIAHLQCNAGQDTLSLAQLGATVTGVDLSDMAIERARELSRESGIEATFVRSDLFDWFDEVAAHGARYDVVYCSYGAVCWIPDLGRWARGIASVLIPGGRFIIIDFHPVAAMFAADWTLAMPYGGGQQRSLAEGVGDYVGASGGGLTPTGFDSGVQDFANPHACHLYLWGLGEIVTALADAGLALTTLREYPYSNGERNFDRMRELPGRRMIPPADVPTLPLMFGLVAHSNRSADVP